MHNLIVSPSRDIVNGAGRRTSQKALAWCVSAVFAWPIQLKTPWLAAPLYLAGSVGVISAGSGGFVVDFSEPVISARNFINGSEYKIS
jgi:hypothetical protein